MPNVVAVTVPVKVEAAFALTVVAATVLLNVVVPALIVNVVKGFEAPIALANVLPVPETVTVPSVVAKPLIVPLIVAVVPENVAEAVDVLSSKVIAVAVTALANVACEFSALAAASPPTMLIFVAVTVPLNDAEPALVVVPTVIVSAATLPENVIREILLLLLLIT